MMLGLKADTLPLAIGLGLPVLFIVLVAGAIYLPSASLSLAHDFLYTTDGYQGYNGYANTYRLESGSLVKVSTGVPERAGYPLPDAPELFYYDASEDTTRSISYADAAVLSLVPGPSSPDGFLIEYSYGGGGFPFGGGGDGGYVARKDGGAKRLPGLAGSGGYRGQIEVVGWVTP